MFDRPLLWKFLMIAVVVAAAAMAAFPPEERINLGLDLQGGLHILIEVQTDDALTYELDLTQSRLGQTFKKQEIGYEAIVREGTRALQIRGTDPARRADVRSALDAYTGEWNASDLGGGNWRVSIPGPVAGRIEERAVETTLETLRRRVDSLGVAEAVIQKQGIEGDRVLIQLPLKKKTAEEGAEESASAELDPNRVKALLEGTEKLEWKEVSYPPNSGDPGTWQPPDDLEILEALFGGQIPPDTEAVEQRYPRPDGGETTVWWPLKQVSVVVGNDLRDAYRSSDEWGDPSIAFELSQDAGKRFEVATRENLGKRMAIVLSDPSGNKKVISAPTIRGVIRDQGVIEGAFDLKSADDLALQLRSGAIPTSLKIIEERTVGPSLGRDSIRRGLIAGLVGFVGVMLFMVVYYRLSGVNAVVALLLNILLVFGTLGALPILFSGAQATLTLPGIAGLILTVGMAVDSNVLIFERIREEMRLGKTVRAAVEQGFGKAFMTILDCNVTTLVSAFFLFSYGTGPVKGFAVTLTIGLLASMFTAVFVSRQIFELWLLGRRGSELSI